MGTKDTDAEHFEVVPAAGGGWDAVMVALARRIAKANSGGEQTILILHAADARISAAPSRTGPDEERLDRLERSRPLIRSRRGP